MVAFACAGGELDAGPGSGTIPGNAGAGGGAAGTNTGGASGGAGGTTAGAGGATAGAAGSTAGGAPSLGLDTAPAAATLGSLTFGAPTTQVFNVGPFVVAAHATSAGFLDLSNPAAPAEVATVPTTASVVAAEYDDATGTAYLLDAAGTLHAVRVLSPEAPLVIGTLKGLPQAATGLARAGDRVFIIAGTTLQPVAAAISGGAATLSMEVAITLPAAPTHVASGGRSLYLGFADGKVDSWSVGAAPAKTGTFDAGGALAGLVAKGSKVIGLVKGKGLRVADFATPAAPALLYADAELSDAFVGRVIGRALVVGLERQLVSVLDLSDFTRPRAVTANTKTLPSWVALVDGNLLFGAGTTATVAAVPPFVAGRVPGLTQQSFPRYGGVPVTFNKRIDPASVGAVTLKCGASGVEGSVVVDPDALRLTFRPSTALPSKASCELDYSKVKGASGGAVSSSTGGKLAFTTSGEAPEPFVQPKSAYPHKADGKHTDWTGQSGGQYEWFDVKPAKGMYTYFYADFDGEKLWLLNDWFYGGDDIEPDCYNQFQVWTGGGKERWEIRAYGDQHVEVRKDGVLIDQKAAGVEGGASFGPSPNVAEPHTQYELSIPASPGAWGVQLHDPGPAFQCQKLETEPSSVVGDSTGQQGTVDPTHAVKPPMPPTLGEVQQASLTPTLTWSTTDDWKNFDAYVVIVSRDAAGKVGRWERRAYGTSLTLPPGLLAPGTQYYWRVLAYNGAGQRESQASSFTTQGGMGGAGGGGGASGAGGSGAAAGAGGSTQGEVCHAANATSMPNGSTTGTKTLAFKYVATASQQVSGAEVYTGGGDGLKNNVLTFFSDSGGKPGQALASGSFAPAKSLGWQGAAFDKVVTTQAGATYWLAWTPTSGQTASLGASGDKIQYCGSDDLSTWDGPFTGQPMYKLDCATGGSGGAGGAGGAPGACAPKTSTYVCDASTHNGAPGAYCEGGSCHGLIHVGEKFSGSYLLTGLTPGQVQSAKLELTMALDDHSMQGEYCFDLKINGVTIDDFLMITGVPHGAPFGGPFNNFVKWSYDIPQGSLSALNSKELLVDLTLGCAKQGDWVVFRQSEMSIVPSP